MKLSFCETLTLWNPFILCGCVSGLDRLIQPVLFDSVQFESMESELLEWVDVIVFECPQQGQYDGTQITVETP